MNVFGAGSRSLLTVLTAVFGREANLEGYSMSGKTDTQIVLELVERSGGTRSEVFPVLEKVWQGYIDGLAQALPRLQPQVFPGIPELLGQLAEHPDVVLGLLTGNVERAAWLKLRRVDLDGYFCLGAFGDCAPERRLLPEVAVAGAQRLTGKHFVGKDVVIIGDTPNDILCGQHLGVKAVAVATGKFSMAQLAPYRADCLLPDFADLSQALDGILG